MPDEVAVRRGLGALGESRRSRWVASCGILLAFMSVVLICILQPPDMLYEP